MTEHVFSSRHEQSLNLYFQIYGFGFSEERDKYLAYRNGKHITFNEGNDLSFIVLNVLENLGFSNNDLGFYVYAELIKKIVYMLGEGIDKKDIIDNLMHNYSDLYFNVAHDNDISTKTLHDYITDAFINIDGKHVNKKLSDNIFGRYSINSYGVKAYLIANYIRDNLMLFDNKPKVKVLNGNKKETFY